MFFDQHLVEKANSLRQNTMITHLGIKFGVDPEGRPTATMPVDARTHQPMGLLHGGATAALAESLGSMASYLLIEATNKAVVGMEVSANHLRGVRSGIVTATGELLHQGSKTHLWDIRVRNEANELCAVCKLSIMIIDLRK